MQPFSRPTDGRYGDNPNRLQRYYQYQMLMKPSPDDIVERSFNSLKALGIGPEVRDLRLVEDNSEPAFAFSRARWGKRPRIGAGRGAAAGVAGEGKAALSNAMGTGGLVH